MNSITLVLLGYLAVMFFVAWFFSRRESLETYFVNTRRTGLWLMTLSSVATVVGAGATVAVVAEVYHSGISYGFALPISLIVGMVVFAIVAKRIKEVGDAYGAYTLVDFFGKRFDHKTKILAGVLQLFLLIIWTSVQAVAMASLASVLVGVNYTLALFLAAAVTILYTAIGGLKIDLITDFIQFWIIFAMFIVMAVIGYGQTGGVAQALAQLPSGHLDPFAFGGVSWFVGVILLSGFLYLGNTAHWQRIFSAENQIVARTSFFLTIPFVAALGLLTVFIGLVAAVILSGIPPETAIFTLMERLLPPGLAGVGFAAILAVIMSSVDSVLIGGSTIIHRAWRAGREIDEKKNLRMARLITGAFGICGFLLAFLIPDIITLSLAVSYLALIFVPAIFAGLYTKKVSARAAFYSILIPTIVLFILFPIVKENTFVITTLLAVLIILFCDKIFKRAPVSSPEIQS